MWKLLTISCRLTLFASCFYYLKYRFIFIYGLFYFTILFFLSLLNWSILSYWAHFTLKMKMKFWIHINSKIWVAEEDRTTAKFDSGEKLLSHVHVRLPTFVVTYCYVNFMFACPKNVIVMKTAAVLETHAQWWWWLKTFYARQMIYTYAVWASVSDREQLTGLCVWDVLQCNITKLGFKRY